MIMNVFALSSIFMTVSRRFENVLITMNIPKTLSQVARIEHTIM